MQSFLSASLSEYPQCYCRGLRFLLSLWNISVVIILTMWFFPNRFLPQARTFPRAECRKIPIRSRGDIFALTEKWNFSQGNIYLDGTIVNDVIRTQEISKQASDCSAIGIVRKKLVDLQQKMGESKSVIMDGRDIGTVVFPDAEYKFYVTASAEERARRRYEELAAKGQDVNYDQVLIDINTRDHNDSTREITPLRKADDAVEVDTTEMNIEEVVAHICGLMGL